MNKLTVDQEKILKTRWLVFSKENKKVKKLNIDDRKITNDLLNEGRCRKCGVKRIDKYSDFSFIRHIFKCYQNEYWLRAGNLKGKK